jgi:hypothetical protein
MYKVTITSTGKVHEFATREEAKAFAKGLRKQNVWCFLAYPK